MKATNNIKTIVSKVATKITVLYIRCRRRLLRPIKYDSGADQNISYKYLWYSFYEHYLINKRYQPQDIFIKADDDIVFVDISSFQLFLNEIINSTGPNIHFLNIINNDAGFCCP